MCIGHNIAIFQVTGNVLFIKLYNIFNEPCKNLTQSLRRKDGNRGPEFEAVKQASTNRLSVR